MSQKPTFDAEKHIDLMAPALGLTVKPEWRGVVSFNLTLAAAIAGAVMAKPMPDVCEPAPIFEADR